ncbi:MAG: NAD(P)H-binding protein [Pseudomonadota bacterium]
MELHAVTGAAGYSGRAIAALLLEHGVRVRSLTAHPERPHPFGARLEVANLAWDDPDALARALAGVHVLYNTWWIRFAHGGVDHAVAVDRSRQLIAAAAHAGVERVVHTSITQPSLDSPLPYFAGKARVEAALRASGMSFAILRPAVFFGGADVLLNNIAFLLRRLPLFGVPGDGRYRFQPIHVEDFARLAVAQGAAREDVVLDAVGPEAYAYDDLVRLLARSVGRPARLVYLPPWMVLAASRLLGPLVGDVVLTREEIAGLMGDLLVSAQAPTGTTRLSAWLEEFGADLGRTWASEVARHYR